MASAGPSIRTGVARLMKLVRSIQAFVEAVLVLLLSAMVLLTFADVLGRRIFGKPIYGAYDITEHLMALTVFAGLPIVTAAAGHLTVDLLDHYLKSDRMRWWNTTISLIAAAIFALIAWLFFDQAQTATQIKEVSQGLNIPRAPLYVYMGLSMALSALASAVIIFTGPLRSVGGSGEEEIL